MENVSLESLLAKNPEDIDFEKKIIKNYKLLIEEWNKFQSVSFVGAGTSVPLGIGDWETLAKNLKEYVSQNYPECINEEELNNKQDLPSYFERLFKIFEARNQKNEFHEIVFRKMEPLYNSTSLTLIKMILVINLHITTNFDSSIEKAYLFLEYLADFFGAKGNKKFKTHSIPNLPSFLEIDRDKYDHLLYLHGKKRSNYVLRMSDYEKFYLSDNNNGEYSKHIEETLKSYIKHTSLFFIGFSFNDIRVKNALFRLIAEIRRDRLIEADFTGVSQPSTPKHFLLVSDSSTNYKKGAWRYFFEEFEKQDIYPIIYEEDNHIFLEHLFDYLKSQEDEL
jgi:hypothetical protein